MAGLFKYTALNVSLSMIDRSLRVVLGSEQAQTQLLLHVGAMLHLEGVIEGAGVVTQSLDGHALSNLVRGEGVDAHEHDELGAVA